MSSKSVKITGWVLTAVLGLLFSFSAFLKITQNEDAIAQASAIGFDAATYRIIGFVEIASLILFIFPRTALLGALLLVAYMGGAIATHLQHQQPIGMAVGVQVVLWVTVAVRFPDLLQRVFSPNLTMH
jgi:hypothetical protein